MSNTDFDHLFKLLLVGDSGVGKSALLLRFSDDTYTDTYISTIGVDFKVKTLHLDDAFIKLQIWDTAGQDRFRSITSSYYRGAHGIIIVFDLSDEESFKNCGQWLRDIDKYAVENVVRVLVGNKCDLVSERVVEYEAAQSFAAREGIVYVEASAKKGINVEPMFLQLTHSIMETIDKAEQELDPDSIHLKRPKRKKEAGCCT